MQKILGDLFNEGLDVKTVCIGGINASNIEQVLFQSASRGKILDGVAIVSAIMAASDPEAEARRLVDLVRAPPRFMHNADMRATEPDEILKLVPAVIEAVHKTTPLSHNMTNLVSQPASH